MKYKIYVDLDGVLTDFDEQFESYFHMTPEKGRTKGQAYFWSIIGRVGTKFWSQMPWMPDGEKLWNHLKSANPTILSTPAKSKASVDGKKIWIKNNLGDHVPYLLQSNKEQHATPESILIDDREKNINKWNEAGGIGILHINANDTIQQLNKILGKDATKTFKQYFGEATKIQKAVAASDWQKFRKSLKGYLHQLNYLNLVNG